MLKTILIKLISFYQVYLSFDRGLFSFLSPGGACKYSPTCSEYTKQMIIKHGLLKGLRLGVKRIISCR